ncbi:hypothetical protein BCR39DRAFT_82365 [Naematelia encephala]|uniref:Uncharacterized protein n=1 Tax=Naematelia encephala TaxID=71784 RepID=A0A1Y2BAH6_9TREE|nr:hypothetical protein BCR39DRAFT_82365 [Naematelia encephala]
MVKFVGETLYTAFKPGPGAQKHSLYQWSLPDGPARHVAESVSHTCMAEHCGRHFGLLGEWYPNSPLTGLIRVCRAEEVLWWLWWSVLRHSCCSR